MKIRVLYNYVLWRLGRREILSSDITQAIEIKDCEESLVLVGDDIAKSNILETDFKLREGALERLQKADIYLNEKGFKILLIQGFRSLEEQRRRWEKRVSSVRDENPDWSNVEVEKEASKFSSKPSGNGPHQTGGAVDLTIETLDSKPVDMGGEYSQRGSVSYTNTKLISGKQRKNRRLLIEAMEHAGFVNYPAEWWHWSYGDRMWAAYGRKRFAIYGSVEDVEI